MSTSGIKTASNKALKPCYKHLTARQKRIIKLHEKYVIADKFLYGNFGFYDRAKRIANGSVDWDSISERMLDTFEDTSKTIAKYLKLNQSELNETLDLFNTTQFSYSQSFSGGYPKILISPHPKFCALQFCIYYLIANFEQEQKEVEQPNYLPVLYSTTPEPKKEFKSKKVQPELHNSKSVKGEIIQSKITRYKTFESAYKLKQFLEAIDSKNKSIYDCPHELGFSFSVPVWVKAENGETVYFIYDYENLTYNYNYIDQQAASLLLPAPKVQTVELDQVKSQDSILDDFKQRVIERTHAKKRIRKQNSKVAGTFERVGIFASVACFVFLFLNTFVMINNYNSNFAELSKPKETNTARARPKQHSNFPIYLAMFGSLAVVKPRKNGTVDYLTQEQIMTVANMLEQRGNGKRHKLIWLVGANTGLRISDILTLTMNDLYQGKLTMQKTQKQVQLVVLEGLLKVCREFAEENDIADNELLFGEKRRRSSQTKVHRQVDVMSNQAIYKVWVDVGNQLGINIGCHTPRKSFGRILYDQTKDISIVAKFLGHTDIASTMHYIGLTKNLMQNTRLDIGLIGL